MNKRLSFENLKTFLILIFVLITLKESVVVRGLY